MLGGFARVCPVCVRRGISLLINGLVIDISQNTHNLMVCYTCKRPFLELKTNIGVFIVFLLYVSYEQLLKLFFCSFVVIFEFHEQLPFVQDEHQSPLTGLFNC